MALFHYKAIGADGKRVDGEMEAADAQSVIAQLRSTGNLPISAVPKTERHDVARLFRLARRKDRVRPADITALTRELATLLHAGIPLDAALRILERHAPAGSRLKTILKRIHEDVRAGKSLSGALAALPDAFDSFYSSLVRAGEASGSLAVVMARLATHREQTEAFRATIVSALTYPAILLCVAFLSLFVLLTFVIPRFIPLFADAGETLPLLTEVVFGTAQALESYWWILVLAVIAAKLAADRWLETPANRVQLDAWLLRAPLIGEVLSHSEAVRFARTLETLLRNGLPLLAALGLVKDVQRNRIVRSMVEHAMDSIRSGGRLAKVLEREGVLPELAVELVMVGEESGQLEEMLERTAETFEMRVQQKIKRMLTLLEPVLILGLGAMIAVVIVSILTAMLSLNELVV
jgi:general secretion pathway protein F